jgi:two-component system, NtrC family, response regulator AtoC
VRKRGEELETLLDDTSLGDQSGEPEHSLVLLIMVKGGVQEFDLRPRKEPVTIGRSSKATIRIDRRSISRIHAAITISADSIVVEDRGSTNGTYVNGERITAPTHVNVGDALRFGKVLAQVGGSRASVTLSPRVVSLNEFEARIREEADRSVRFNRSLAVLTVSVPDTTDEDALRTAVVRHLRRWTVLSARAKGRVDVLLPECPSEEARSTAKQILDALGADRIKARIGIAAYPDDVPSPESIILAAQMAMLSVEEAGIAVASGGTRTVHLGEREAIIAEPAMIRLFSLIERVAAAQIAALIIGETGTGKEIVASALHYLGPRSARPLVAINCAAVPADLLESELFGHERGAFSGAVDAKVGLFEAASGGTVFLDEIGEMSPALQAKLLRFLEEKRLRRLGATKEIAVDVRVVAATHRDLNAAVAEGNFRQDLLYRLGAIVLRVPPLRERPREIAALAERFAREAAKEAGRDEITLTDEAIAVLQSHDWPGNVRELRNVVMGAVMMANSPEIKASHLAWSVSGPQTSGEPNPDYGTGETKLTSGQLALEDEIRELERRRIIEALEECEGNQTKAASLLKMPRRTLVSKLSALNIQVKRRRSRR